LQAKEEYNIDLLIEKHQKKPLDYNAFIESLKTEVERMEKLADLEDDIIDEMDSQPDNAEVDKVLKEAKIPRDFGFSIGKPN
jgi:hypothetical protein